MNSELFDCQFFVYMTNQALFHLPISDEAASTVANDYNCAERNKRLFLEPLLLEKFFKQTLPSPALEWSWYQYFIFFCDFVRNDGFCWQTRTVSCPILTCNLFLFLVNIVKTFTECEIYGMCKTLVFIKKSIFGCHCKAAFGYGCRQTLVRWSLFLTFEV